MGSIRVFGDLGKRVRGLTALSRCMVSFRAAPVSLCIVLFAFSGCVVGPDYLQPDIKTPEVFQSNAAEMKSAQTEVRWWRLFDDPLLHSLIDRAVAGNKDIAIARARLEQSRQLLAEARYSLYPTIRANGGYNKSSISASQAFGLSGSSFPGDAGDGVELSQRQIQRESYELGFDASWELDIFGRVRRANEQREANLEATEAGLRDVLVSLISEVGRTYVKLRGDQNRLAVTRKNAENQRETLKLTQARLEGGQATELDTSRARAQLNNTLALTSPFEAAVEASIYRLSVLLGEQPLALVAELSPVKPLPKLPSVVDIGDPKSLLQRRPDIRVAERNLAAATAEVGVATADLYPRITFTGSIGYNARTPNDFGPDSESWSFGPGINWAAFDLGRVRAILRASEANSDAALAQFESKVLNALEETQRAFVAFTTSRKTKFYLTEASNASAKAAELANLRYRDGVTDFITVLDAERVMLEAQDRLAQSETDTAISLVAVYKALGGGWEAFEDPEPIKAQIQSIVP